MAGAMAAGATAEAGASASVGATVEAGVTAEAGAILDMAGLVAGGVILVMAGDILDMDMEDITVIIPSPTVIRAEVHCYIMII